MLENGSLVSCCLVYVRRHYVDSPNRYGLLVGPEINVNLINLKDNATVDGLAMEEDNVLVF